MAPPFVVIGSAFPGSDSLREIPIQYLAALFSFYGSLQTEKRSPFLDTLGVSLALGWGTTALTYVAAVKVPCL